MLQKIGNHTPSESYMDEKIARASAVLPAAGAYDTTPVVMDASEFEVVSFYCKYTRGAAGGRVRLKIEVSPESSGSNWYQVSTIAIGTVTPGADSVSAIQREAVEYGATGAGAEAFVYGPVGLGRTIHRVRIAAAESGVVGTPGTAEILARFA